MIAVIDAGAALDPAGKEGLALLTARALVEGAAGLTERAERLGTELDADADWDTALLNLTVLSERVDEALELVGEILTSPHFPIARSSGSKASGWPRSSSCARSRVGSATRCSSASCMRQTLATRIRKEAPKPPSPVYAEMMSARSTAPTTRHAGSH